MSDLEDKVEKWWQKISVCCRIVVILSIILIAMFSCSSVNATERYRPIINNEITNITNNYNCDGAALSNAMAAINFDMNVTGLQGGAGIGGYNSEHCNSAQGAAFGIGQRVCFDDGSCGIVNGSVGVQESGGEGFNFGITWTF